MAFSETLSQCTALWRAQGVSLGPPRSEAEIRHLWSELGHRISDDVLTLYSTLGGFAEYEFDGTSLDWSLWPWDWLIKRNREERRSRVMFCDHSIEIATWELRYRNKDVSSVWLYDHPTAPSLESFFNTYLDDPWKLMT